MDTYDMEKKSMEIRFSDKEKVLIDKVSKLEEFNRDLGEKRLELESQLKEASSRLRIIDRDFLTNQREYEKLKEEFRIADKAKHELERENAALAVESAQLGPL